VVVLKISNIEKSSLRSNHQRGGFFVFNEKHFKEQGGNVMFYQEDLPWIIELHEDVKKIHRNNLKIKEKKICPVCGEELRTLRGSDYCPNLLRHPSASSQDKTGVFLQI
jgi:hypothetical protein